MKNSTDAEAQEDGGIALDPKSLSLARLVFFFFFQHIVRRHHQRIRQDLPRLVEMARKVTAKRGDRGPELAKIAELTEKLHDEMHAHILKEEQVLFPFISQMDQESIVAYPASQACFRSVVHPIFMMEQQHESANLIMAALIRLTNHFESPPWPCATHIALLSGLRDFEIDLKEHCSS